MPHWPDYCLKWKYAKASRRKWGRLLLWIQGFEWNLYQSNRMPFTTLNFKGYANICYRILKTGKMCSARPFPSKIVCVVDDISRTDRYLQYNYLGSSAPFVPCHIRELAKYAVLQMIRVREGTGRALIAYHELILNKNELHHRFWNSYYMPALHQSELELGKFGIYQGWPCKANVLR